MHVSNYLPDNKMQTFNHKTIKDKAVSADLGRDVLHAMVLRPDLPSAIHYDMRSNTFRNGGL